MYSYYEQTFIHNKVDMPRTEEQWQALRDESRERLLHSALHLFAQHGYAAATIRSIAREAGVSLGLVYNYFPGKEALLLAIFEQSMADVQASFAQAREAEGDPLAAILQASTRIVRNNRDFWRLSYGLRFQSALPEELAGSLAEWSTAILWQLTELLALRKVAHPELEARVLFALIDGICQHDTLDPEHYPLDDVLAAALKRFQPRRTS